MARGDNLDKTVRKIKSKKRSAVHKMVEALIRGDSEVAAEELRSYLQLQTRDLILGEADEDSEDKDEDSEDKDDDSEDKDDDKPSEKKKDK